MLVGFCLLGLAAVFWGSSAGAVRAFTDQTGAPGVVIAFAEALIAAPLLFAVAVAAGAPWPSARRALPAAVGTGALVAGFLASYFTAIGRVGITVASLVAICSAPLFTTVLAVLVLRERPSRAMLLALVLGVVGTGFVLTGPTGGLDSIEGRSGWGEGIALALVAGLCFGTENVVVRRLMRRHDPMQLAALTTIASVWLLAPLALPRGGIVRASLDGWPWLLYLSVFPTALAPVLHNAGLKRVSAISAGIVGLLEPLTAATVGLLVFHEALGLMGALGAALLLLAIALLYVSQRTALQETATVSASAAEPLSSDDA